jgi:hypothetical protein
MNPEQISEKEKESLTEADRKRIADMSFRVLTNIGLVRREAEQEIEEDVLELAEALEDTKPLEGTTQWFERIQGKYPQWEALFPLYEDASFEDIHDIATRLRAMRTDRFEKKAA